MSRFRPLSLLVILLVLVGLGGCVEPGLMSEEYSTSFFTVPRTLPDTLESDSTHFVVLGDVQSGWKAEHAFYKEKNWKTWKQLLFPFYQMKLLSNGVTGAINYKRQLPDYGDEGRAVVRRALVEEFREERPAFWMILGDMAAHDGRRAPHWGQFLEEYRPLYTDAPLLPVLGNHEYSNDSLHGGPNYEAIFDYGRFYVQDMPDASVFVLNSNFLVDQHGLLDDDQQDALFEEWFVSSDPANPAWLERELARRADQPFKIVAMHHPPLSLSWHAHDWYEAEHGRDLVAKRQKLMALLKRHGVQVVFAGHEHLYERSVLRYRGADGGEREMYQIISSGGGVPPREEATAEEIEARLGRYDAEGFRIGDVVQKQCYHYTTVDLTPGRLEISTFEVDPDAPEDPRLLDRVAIPAPKPEMRLADGQQDQTGAASATR